MFSIFFQKLFFKYQKIKSALNVMLLKLLGAKIGKNVTIYGSIHVIGDCKNLIIGENCTLNEGVFLNCRDQIIIEDNCRISPFVQLHTGGLNFEQLNRCHYKGPILLKKNVWIASNCIVNPNIVIEENSVIGGGSVVTRDVEKNSFYAGVPAKKIKGIKVD